MPWVSFFLHLKALHALEFDGGGSSAMVARLAGSAQRLNELPTGQSSERLVPAGLGVIEVEEVPDPFFQHMDLFETPDGLTLSWVTAEPATDSVRFGTGLLDRTQAALSCSAGRHHHVVLQGLPEARPVFLRIESQRGERVHSPPLISLIEPLADVRIAGLPSGWIASGLGPVFIQSSRMMYAQDLDSWLLLTPAGPHQYFACHVNTGTWSWIDQRLSGWRYQFSHPGGWIYR